MLQLNYELLYFAGEALDTVLAQSHSKPQTSNTSPEQARMKSGSCGIRKDVGWSFISHTCINSPYYCATFVIFSKLNSSLLWPRKHHPVCIMFHFYKPVWCFLCFTAGCCTSINHPFPHFEWLCCAKEGLMNITAAEKRSRRVE